MAGPRITLPPLEIIYRDVWVMQYLYRVMHYWLIENGWADLLGNVDHENMEILYMERRGTHFNPAHRELRIWWRLQKKPTFFFGGSVYYNYRLDVDFNVIQMTDVEIMKDGQKVRAQHGELRLMINPYIELETGAGSEYAGKPWREHPILKYIESYFRARILKRTLEDHKKEVYRDAYRFQGMIKKYLELKTFMPDMEVFHQKFEYI